MTVRPSVFPLNNSDASANAAAEKLSTRYKNMLGSQAAGQDVGLFYQLDQSANARLNAVEDRSAASLPIEAGGQYA